MITNSAQRIVRYIALPIVSAGIIGGAALGLAGTANAATPPNNPDPRPGIVAVPQTKAKPAAEAHPGAWWHRHHPSLIDPSSAWQFVAPFGSNRPPQRDVEAAPLGRGPRSGAPIRRS